MEYQLYPLSVTVPYEGSTISWQPSPPVYEGPVVLCCYEAENITWQQESCSSVMGLPLYMRPVVVWTVVIQNCDDPVWYWDISKKGFRARERVLSEKAKQYGSKASANVQTNRSRTVSVLSLYVRKQESAAPTISEQEPEQSKTLLYLAPTEMTETNHTHTVCPALPCPSYRKVQVLTQPSTLSCLLQSDILVSFPLGPGVACHDLFL